MASTGDIIEVVLEQTFANQTCLNVFYYRVEDVPTATYLDGLATEFQFVVLNAMKACQSVGLIYREIRLSNLFNDDFLVVTNLNPSGGTYVGVGEQVTSVTACGIYFRPSNKRVRRGYKFIVGFTEGDIVGNLFSVSYLSLVSAAAQAMTVSLSPGLGVDTFKPVIIKRVRTAPNRYRLPQSQSELGNNWAYIVGHQVRPIITTMRSRKQRI